jgi:mitogen-activated protein kinase kinase kinase
MARGNDNNIDDWARDTGTHQYPSVNPLFQPGGTYQSPPTSYSSEVPTPAYRDVVPPSGFNRGYSDTIHARDQQEVQGQGRRNTAANIPRRQDARGLHPYAYGADQGARSADNLRPYPAQAQSQSQANQNRPYIGPSRTSITPQPQSQGGGTFPQPNIYRSPSAEHAQDGRYPDPARTSIPFPSPQPRSSATWTETSPPPSASSGMRRPGSRPSSLHDSPPLGTSSALLPRRPNTLHDHSPPDSAQSQTHGDEYYRPDWQPRSISAGTATTSYRDLSPTDRGPERLPYERAHTESWLSVPGRHDSGDTASSSGMSEATEVQRSVEDENSNDTARQKDWTAIMGDLIGNAKGPAAGIAGGTGPVEDEEEATLFLPSSSAQNSLNRRQIVRSPPSKPHLTVDTRTNSPSQPTTDSATDSETETTGGGKVKRGKSFARPEPGQWHTRPEPEQLYDRLDKYFPKVDLDQPIVDNPASTPSTPGESPGQTLSPAGLPPPPLHPSRAPATSYEPNLNPMISPRTENIPRAPPMHPARSAFNKAENRKSIRVMADYKRKTLLKQDHPKESVSTGSSSKDGVKDKDEMKLSRRMSMWGHRVVEVTASKLNLGQIPLSTPESPAETEDTTKPQTLNWVKGELIGKGSYGRVYIALNISTGDMMAVKQVELPATERDRNDRKQLGQIESLRVEIALLKDMYHPNIVAYLGFETSPEYLSM